MPKRNHLPERPDFMEITEKSQRNYVQKQKSLMLLQDSELPLTSLKIIDLYLSKLDNYIAKELTPEGIERKKLSQKRIVINGGDLERSLGVTKINRPALLERIRSLMYPIDTNPYDDEHILAIPLFKRIKADKEDGYWSLDLEMSEDAEDLIFIPENIHYLRYRLLNVVNLTSRYAYFLYMYLEDQRFMHTDWRIDLDEFKEILGCNTQARYQEFKYFNREVIAKAQAELAERTDCRFTYEPCRRGRGGKVVGIKFHLEPKIETKYRRAPEQISIDDMLEDNSPIDISSDLTEEENKAITIMRLKIDNPLIDHLSDTTLAACYRELDDKYGQYSGDYQTPLDYDIEQFTLVLDRVRAEIENKRINGEPEIKKLNSYVLQATLNFWKEGR